MKLVPSVLLIVYKHVWSKNVHKGVDSNKKKICTIIKAVDDFKKGNTCTCTCMCDEKMTCFLRIIFDVHWLSKNMIKFEGQYAYS